MSAYPTSPPIGPLDVEWAFPEIERARLSNGVPVELLRRQDLPIVHLRLETLGGRWLASKPGRGVLAGSVARHGTQRFDSATLATRLDALGAQLGLSAGLDAQHVTAFGLEEHLDTLLESMAQVALYPTFPESELTRIARQSADRRRHSRSQPGSRAGEWLAAGLYGLEHPYGRGRPAPEDYLEATRDELVAFQSVAWQPDTSGVFAVGDVTLDRLVSRLESELAGWEGSASHPQKPGAPVRRSSRRVIAIDHPVSQQATVRIGFQAMARSADDFLAARIMNRILGGGASSRLFQDLREARSLTYGCSSNLDAARFSGDLVAGLACSHVNLEEALDSLRENLERMAAERVPDSELDAVKDYMVGAFPGTAATVGGLGQLLASRWRHDLPADAWKRWTRDVQSVDADAILEAARAVIDLDRAVVVVVGEGSAVARALDGWGELEAVEMESPVT